MGILICVIMLASSCVSWQLVFIPPESKAWLLYLTDSNCDSEEEPLISGRCRCGAVLGCRIRVAL